MGRPPEQWLVDINPHLNDVAHLWSLVKIYAPQQLGHVKSVSDFEDVLGLGRFGIRSSFPRELLFWVPILATFLGQSTQEVRLGIWIAENCFDISWHWLRDLETFTLWLK